jgi:DNA mismatch endonuclease (patch repair protein)
LAKQSKEWIRKRVESRKGYHPTEETLRKQSEAKKGSKNPMYGKPRSQEAIQKFIVTRAGYKHSNETRQKIREARLRFYKEHPEAIPKGEKNPMYGTISVWRDKHLPEKIRLKISQQRKGKYNGSDNPFFGKRHTEHTREIMKDKWKHRSFKEKDNKLELRFQKELKIRNIIFQKQAEILGRPDIFIQPNICIFVDGCYWHGCKCKFNPEWSGEHAEYIKSRMKHDIEVNQKLHEAGYVVLRFWEHEILGDINSCISKINSYYKIEDGRKYDSK